ncbi:GNAT family N-acetyltransferase [Desulfurococcaceae archaeon MEX13E-LK6-19]|nr:GNAT family N-acetyltransferase [Desulfurococcaceae archaeon MEX13E-LK6-19]
MLRLVEGYCGGNDWVDNGIALLYNKCRLASIAWAMRAKSVDNVRDMFKSTWFDPREFALVMFDNRIVGCAWALIERNCRIGLCIDPYQPPWVVEEATRMLLAWARHSFEKRGARGVVTIGGWDQFGFMYRLLRRILDGVLLLEDYVATLMVYVGLKSKPSVPEGYMIKRGSMSDIPRVVEIFNKAFSIYDWFHPWDLEDARRYFERYKPILYVAVDRNGEIVGYADAMVFKAVDDRETGVVATVAVDPNHQRRGLGKALVATIVKELENKSVKRIYLDGVKGLEALYAKLGFKEYSRWIRFTTTLPSLPQSLPSYSIYTRD